MSDLCQAANWVPSGQYGGLHLEPPWVSVYLQGIFQSVLSSSIPTSLTNTLAGSYSLAKYPKVSNRNSSSLYSAL